MSQVNARFCFNNWFETSSLSSSSSLANYPATNLLHPIRSKLWKSEGVFEITPANKWILINGGAYQVQVGSYNLSGLIAAFNVAVVVPGLTLSRNSYGRFVITSGASVTLNLSFQIETIWSTLGFLTTTDQTGTTFTADERRYSTGEWFKVDMLIPQRPDFGALIPEANAKFSCPLSSIKLQGNNLDDWASPPVNVAFDVSDQGAMIAPNDLKPCRFWRVFIDDKTTQNISAAVLYLGTAAIPQNTNIATGFSRQRSDQSNRLYSESGTLYVDRRPKVLSLTSLGVQFLNDDDLAEIEQLFYDIGVEKPFFICIDPAMKVSRNLSDMTHYVYVTSDLEVQHILRGYYNIAVEVREVL